MHLYVHVFNFIHVYVFLYNLKNTKNTFCLVNLSTYLLCNLINIIVMTLSLSRGEICGSDKVNSGTRFTRGVRHANPDPFHLGERLISRCRYTAQTARSVE